MGIAPGLGGGFPDSASGHQVIPTLRGVEVAFARLVKTAAVAAVTALQRIAETCNLAACLQLRNALGFRLMPVGDEIRIRGEGNMIECS